MTRTCRRRTFDQILREQEESLARYLDAHAEKLGSADQPNEAVAVSVAWRCAATRGAVATASD